MSALGKMAAAPATDADARATWDVAEGWHRSLVEAKSDAMPEAVFVAVDRALCAAMRHLIQDVRSPDGRALILKMELMRDLLDDAVPSGWWDAVEADVARLTVHRPQAAGASELDRLIAGYVEADDALKATKGLPDGNPVEQAFLAATEALDAYQPRTASEFVRSLAARFGEDMSLPTEEAMGEISRIAVRLVAEGC